MDRPWNSVIDAKHDNIRKSLERRLLQQRVEITHAIDAIVDQVKLHPNAVYRYRGPEWLWGERPLFLCLLQKAFPHSDIEFSDVPDHEKGEIVRLMDIVPEKHTEEKDESSD